MFALIPHWSSVLCSDMVWWSIMSGSHYVRALTGMFIVMDMILALQYQMLWHWICCISRGQVCALPIVWSLTAVGHLHLECCGFYIEENWCYCRRCYADICRTWLHQQHTPWIMLYWTNQDSGVHKSWTFSALLKPSGLFVTTLVLCCWVWNESRTDHPASVNESWGHYMVGATCNSSAVADLAQMSSNFSPPIIQWTTHNDMHWTSPIVSQSTWILQNCWTLY